MQPPNSGFLQYYEDSFEKGMFFKSTNDVCNMLSIAPNDSNDCCFVATIFTTEIVFYKNSLKEP